MIVVLTILGLVAGIVISRGPAHSAAVDLRSATTRLLQGMRAARAQAIAAGAPQAFSVASDQHSFRVGNGVPQALPQGVAARIEVGGRPAAAIDFLPDGSSGGGAVLVAGATRKMEVTVDWLSGHMHVGDLAP